MKHLTVLALAAMLLASTAGCSCFQRWFCCKGAAACPAPVAPPISCGVPVDTGCATGCGVDNGAVMIGQ